MHELLMANKDSEVLPAESSHDTPCDFNEVLSTVQPNSLADTLSVYLESCEPFHVTDTETANSFDEPNISRTDALVEPFNSIVLTESSGLRDNDGKYVIENKVKEIKRSSTRRSTRKSSSNQRTNTKLTARKGKKNYGKRLVLDLLAVQVGKGQRSNLGRRARHSPWGLGRKIDEIFKENAEKYVDPNEHLESRKGNIGHRGAKKNGASAQQNIQNSLCESQVSNKGLLLKFKLGTRGIQNCQFNTIPDMEKDVESYREVKIEASTLQSDIKNSCENEKQILTASNGNLDKELASSKSVENGCLDPGTSPDSEVINVILETQISGTNTTEGLLHDTQISSKDSISHQPAGDFGAGSGIPSPEIVNDVITCDKSVNGDNKQIEGSWSSGAFNGQNSMEPKADDYRIPGIESLESLFAEKLKSNGPNLEKNSRSKGMIKSGVPGLVSKKKTNCGLKGSQSRSTAKENIKDNTGKGPDFDTQTHLVTGSDRMNDAAGALYNSNMVPSEGESRQGSPPSAWVCCDDCHKWRRISAVLADAIESAECRWICKDNMDKAFADCSIPQEKSNADINEELELSEASCEEDACNTRLNSSKLGQKQLIDTPQPSWKLIKTNMFLHRNRKNQPIDEVMVCHCRPPVDGRMGCRDECLNRMLNIECVKGTCPCGEFCSNQQFQKRKYSKLKCVPSGKKGYGLQLQEDIPKGRFLIEYVGEVLDMPAYEARQREYASKGHKHFYFMTLNGSEVIDACAKGNLGRFINHSCEPNCRTEKWMVNGEVCIGLFAIRDIEKGEELTFDYNYVRVFGAAAKKCVCGSSRCRGVIGGDLLTDETVVLGDSDEEYPEPVMFYENSNNKLDTVSVMQTPESISKNNLEDDQILNSLLVTDEKNNDSEIPVESTEREVSFESKIEQTERLLPSCVVPLDKKGKSETELPLENITSVNLLPEDGNSKKKLNPKSHTNEKNRMVLKPQPQSKLHSPSSAVKRGKSKSKKPETDSKPLLVPQKPKKIVVDNLTGRFEAVEEALNTLLTKGGISKRRDASKGYLTLLCLTANGGNGEGIQSNRDLSMILDALLRTKSRTVLLDIINKNGLQMLHILMKRYRKVFNKTPILRKLLKVLEFLAETKILTLENILKPSLPGVESFKESILSLTEHADKEVHQIARNFRDRHIPWSARRVNRAERDTERNEFQQNSNFRSLQSQQSREIRPCEVADNNIIKRSLGANTNTPPVVSTTLEGSSASCLSSCTDGTRIRKRKSRWDQPASPSKKEFRSKLGSENMNNVEGDMDGDAPPGFASPINRTSIPSLAFHQCKTVMGQPQERYVSRLPTAFGIPCSLVKKIGTAEEGAVAESWIVAPAMTYHPFPPLPIYPRGENRHVKEQSWGKCTDRTRVPFNQPNFSRDRNTNTLGKRYFKQQKWSNNSKSGFPWNPNKYGPPGFTGPNKNQPNIGVGYGGNEANGTYNTASYYQHQPRHQ